MKMETLRSVPLAPLGGEEILQIMLRVDSGFFYPEPTLHGNYAVYKVIFYVEGRRVSISVSVRLKPFIKEYIWQMSVDMKTSSAYFFEQTEEIVAAFERLLSCTLTF